MITLKIGNSMSQITGLTVERLKDLSKVLSYDIGASAAYYSGSHNTKRSLLSKRGEFPTGLIYLVEEWLGHTPVVVNDLRERPTHSPKMFTLRLE